MGETIKDLELPMPTGKIFDSTHPFVKYAPAPELNDFLLETVLDENHFLFNLEHIHLFHATIGFMWANEPNKRQGRQVIATAEIPMLRGNRWQKGRQEQQLHEFFGLIPNFIITFDAHTWLRSEAPSIMSTFEHELYHCGQATNEFGMPRFSKQTGKPLFCLQGHDVEEHIGVVRRYGIQASGQDAVDFVEAALQQPEISPAKLMGLCGVCAR